MTVQFSSQAIAALSAPPLQVWQTITLGTYKGVDAYRDVMDSAGVKIRDSANEILGRPAKLLIWSFLCSLLVTRAQAQETERRGGI
jgi:hypothetical protein